MEASALFDTITIVIIVNNNDNRHHQFIIVAIFRRGSDFAEDRLRVR
jgi:hypothetical protein